MSEKAWALIPLCDIEGCYERLSNPHYFLVRDSDRDPVGRQIKVCPEHAKMLNQRLDNPPTERGK